MAQEWIYKGNCLTKIGQIFIQFFLQNDPPHCTTWITKKVGGGGEIPKCLINIPKYCWSVHTEVFRYLRVWISSSALAISFFYLLALNRIIIFAIQGYGYRTMKWMVLSLIDVSNHLPLFLISENIAPVVGGPYFFGVLSLCGYSKLNFA